jgi:hypothetical protein
MNAAWAVMEWFVGLFVVFFIYTFMWDIYLGFWNMALQAGANSVVMSYMYSIHIYLPVLAFIGLSITFLVRMQRRPTG